MILWIVLAVVWLLGFLASCYFLKSGPAIVGSWGASSYLLAAGWFVVIPFLVIFFVWTSVFQPKD